MVAGIAGVKDEDVAARNPSAILLRAWINDDTFTWLVSAAVLDEYVEVLRRCRVRRSVIGTVMNRAEADDPREVTRSLQVPDGAEWYHCGI